MISYLEVIPDLIFVTKQKEADMQPLNSILLTKNF